MKFWTKLRALFRKKTLEREMAEEMQAHLDDLTERNIAKGLSSTEARQAAQRTFGGVEQIKERARDERGWVWLEQLGQDVRYGLRQLRKSPGFTIVAVLTLSIGIGLATSMFSIVSNVILQPLPYPQPDRLLSVTEYSHEQNRWWWASGGVLHEWQKANSFESISAIRPFAASLTGRGAPVRLSGGQVLPGYFETYGINPFLGRDFSPPDTTSDRAREIILSHKLWASEFGGQTDIVGRQVQLDGEVHTIVGVMPGNFQNEAESPAFYLSL